MPRRRTETLGHEAPGWLHQPLADHVGKSQAKALTLSAMSQTRFLESRCSSFGRGWPQKVSTLQWQSNLLVVVVEIHWWSETLLIIFLLGIQCLCLLTLKADEFTQSS